jgi:hypothetical protein
MGEMRAWLLAVTACVSGPPARHPRVASQPDITVFQNAADVRITEGDEILPIAPDAAYAELADFTRWPSVFPDIYTVSVTAQTGDDARVTFIGPEDHHDNVHFLNRPHERVIWFEDTGGSATVWAEIAFLPGAAPDTTHVHSRLFAEVNGVAGIFVSDDKIRKMREQRVYDDLYDLHVHFKKLP